MIFSKSVGISYASGDERHSIRDRDCCKATLAARLGLRPELSGHPRGGIPRTVADPRIEMGTILIYTYIHEIETVGTRRPLRVHEARGSCDRRGGAGCFGVAR